MGSLRAENVVLREIVPEQLSAAEITTFANLMTAMKHELDPTEAAVADGWVTARYYSSSSLYPKRFVAAVQNETFIGLAHIEIDRSGQNDDTMYIEIEVHPDRRRLGVGSALLEQTLDIAAEEGASKIVTFDVHSDATSSFWNHHGAALGYTERMSKLRIEDIDHELLDTWIDAAQPARDDGYELRSWRVRCPDDDLEVFVGAINGMRDAPLEDLDLQPELHTAASVREHEERWRSVGSETRLMMIVAPDGSPASMTEMIVHSTRPEEVWQEATTTLEHQRRKGLGRWIKAAMLKDLLADQGDADFILTGNADSNASMLNLNVALGYKPHAAYACFQASVETLRS